MTRYPIDEWEARAREVEKILYPPDGRPTMAGNAMEELDPELAALLQAVARGRSYGDPAVDLKTRSLCTVACMVALGEPAYTENWINNAMAAGATQAEVVAIISQLYTYVGTLKAVSAYTAAKAAFDKRAAAESD